MCQLYKVASTSMQVMMLNLHNGIGKLFNTGLHLPELSELVFDVTNGVNLPLVSVSLF